MNLYGFIISKELVGDLEMKMKYRDFRRSLSPPSHKEYWIISTLISRLQEKLFQNA